MESDEICLSLLFTGSYIFTIHEDKDKKCVLAF